MQETARASLHDVRALLHLIDGGDIRGNDATRWPTQAAMTIIAGVLMDGDFYTEGDDANEGRPIRRVQLHQCDQGTACQRQRGDCGGQEHIYPVFALTN